MLRSTIKLKSKSILIVSNEAWGKQWYIKHHWANELSKNNKVYFLNPANSFNFKFAFFRSEKISENLSLITYQNQLPLTGKFQLIQKFNELLIWRKIMKIDRSIDISLSFDPFRPYLSSNSKLTSIYYAADDYKTLNEFKLVKRANIVIAVSEVLAHKLNTKYVIGHGVPDQQFSETKNISPPPSFFCGATFSDRIDYELLLKLTEVYPNYNLILAGPDNTNKCKSIFHKLINQPSVNYLGIVDYNQFIHQVELATVCLVPYSMSSRGNMINSLKIIQYLSKSKPVVATIFEDYKIHLLENKKLIYMANNQNEFIECVEIAMREDKSNQSIPLNRFKFASQFFYSTQIDQLETIITQTLT